jgi:hypothetical protein
MTETKKTIVKGKTKAWKAEAKLKDTPGHRSLNVVFLKINKY